MGKYNVIPTILAARAENRATEEQNYIAQRRKVKDAQEDRTTGLANAAQDERLQKYGAQGYDTTNLGQIEGIQQRKDLHPAEVEQAGLRTTGMKTANDASAFQLGEAQAESARAGAGRLYSAMQAAGVKDRATANAWLAAQSPEGLQKITGQPTDPAKVPMLLDQLDSAPGGFEAGLRAQRQAMGTPERYRQIVTGIDPKTGKPVMKAISEDQAPGDIGVNPDDRDHDLDMEAKRLANEQARANIKYTNERTRGGAAGTKATPEEQAAKLDALMFSIGDTKTILGDASRSGAITNDQGDFVGNLFTGDNPAGRFIGNLTGDPKETLRTQLDNKAQALLNALIHMDGSTSSRLFDSNSEKQGWLDALGVKGSYQARLKAIEDFERLAQSRMKDPRRLNRAPLDSDQPKQQQQQAPAPGLSENEDGSYTWSPGTD